ncbi:DNA primase [Desulfuromonas acetoxidans]|uniref:DNA primase n=1 Tax=Desulfuromonas acetoxidans TaxID=891 RepID=UPI00292DF4ED|nr:DNA primase [Desulfuromonas acetoxidans]
MARIPEDLISQVRERVDIVDVVSGYVKLKHSGDNHLGLCPFHSEKTPSFNVNSSRQIFHCFGCGVGGNVFSFLMRMEGLAFPQAVKRLADQVGVVIPDDEPSPEEVRRRLEREELAEVYEQATRFYHDILLADPRGAQARGYIRRRGFDSEAVRRFRLGFSPDSWDALCEHLTSEGTDLDKARQLGLIRRSDKTGNDFDMFRQRLLFPIEDLSGKVVAFGGRVLDDSLPKYINSPESALYHKSRLLYGLYQAKQAMRRERAVIVVEGYFDHLALVQAGIEHVVATCGTALTDDHAKILKRYVERVVLLFDEDAAGQKACFRAMPSLLQQGLEVMTLSLPAGDDPDSCVRREGAEAFLQRLNEARSAIEVHMEVTLEQAGDRAEAQARAIDTVLQMMQRVPDDIQRNLHLGQLAQRSGVTVELLQRQLERTQVEDQPPAPRPQPAPRPAVAPRPVEPEEIQGDLKAQKWLLTLMLADGGVSGTVEEQGIDALFDNAVCQKVAQQIQRAHAEQREPGEWMLDQCEDPRAQDLLTQLLVREQELVSDDIEKIFGDCRQAVVRSQLKQRRAELHTQMRAAEQHGDSEKQTACLQELTRINRELKRRG